MGLFSLRNALWCSAGVLLEGKKSWFMHFSRQTGEYCKLGLYHIDLSLREGLAEWGTAACISVWAALVASGILL